MGWFSVVFIKMEVYKKQPSIFSSWMIVLVIKRKGKAEALISLKALKIF